MRQPTTWRLTVNRRAQADDWQRRGASACHRSDGDKRGRSAGSGVEVTASSRGRGNDSGERVYRWCVSEPEVVLPMRHPAGLWQTLFPAERCRLAQRPIERVVIADGGLEIIWRDQGWQELAGELLPGTIRAELQEMEDRPALAGGADAGP